MIRGVGTAQETFATMLRERIAPALRELGFRGSAQNYALPTTTHWALLGFQRSKWSDSRRVSFTINVTVVAREAWAHAYAQREWIGMRPTAIADHGPRSGIPTYWHERVGSLLPQQRDRWWDLDSDGDLNTITTEVIAAIRDFVLPAMREHIT